MVASKGFGKMTLASTLEEAGSTLRRASKIAEQRQEVEVLLSIAAGWIELHERISGTKSPRHGLGFQSSRPFFDLTGSEADEGEEDEDDSAACDS